MATDGGASTLTTATPSCEERAAADVLWSVDTASSAAEALGMIILASTRTLAARTVTSTSSACGNWRSSARRTAAVSKEDTSPAAVKPIVTTGRDRAPGLSGGGSNGDGDGKGEGDGADGGDAGGGGGAGEGVGGGEHAGARMSTHAFGQEVSS